MESTEKDLRARLRQIHNSFNAYRIEEGAVEIALAAIVAERLKGKYFQLKSYNEGRFAKVIERDTEHKNGFRCIIINTGTRVQGQEIFMRSGLLSVRELDDPEMADEIDECHFLREQEKVVSSIADAISEIKKGRLNGEITLRTERNKQCI